MKEVQWSVTIRGDSYTVGIAEKEIVYKFYPDIHPLQLRQYTLHTVFKNTDERSKKSTLFYCGFNRDTKPLLLDG